MSAPSLSRLPGLNPDNVVSNAHVFAVKGGLAVVSPITDRAGYPYRYHIDVYACDGGMKGCVERSLANAVKSAKAFGREYANDRFRTNQLKEALRLIVENLP